MPELGYVYILASKHKRLYIGVTTKLQLRVWQHKQKIHPESFTAKYNINQLVHFERFAAVTTAIAREKELKGWLRLRKIALIVANNPTWQDLSKDWGKPIEALGQEQIKEARACDPSSAPSEYRDPSLRSG